MGISSNKFYLKENERLLYYAQGHIIDYFRINHKIIYLVDRYKIIEQDGSNTRIIYENHGEHISKLIVKNNHIIFLENHVFKKIDLDKLDSIEEIFDCTKIPSDFCVY